MATPEPETSYVRRVVLPSGKEIQVVHFPHSEVDWPVAAAPPGRRQPTDEGDEPTNPDRSPPEGASRTSSAAGP